MKLSLKTFELRNYRSCIDTRFSLARGLSVLIGTNGSGKTNVLNGMLLLRKLCRTHSRAHSPTQRYSCTLRAVFADIKDKTMVPIDAEVMLKTDEHNVDEVLGGGVNWDLSNANTSSHKVRFPFIGDELLMSSGLPRSSPESFFKYFVLPHGLKRKDTTTFFDVNRSVTNYVSGMSYYSASQFTDPSQCPIHIELEGGELSRRYALRSREHAKFLHNLFSVAQDDPAVFDEYLSFVGRLGVNLVDSIRFKKIPAPTNEYDVRIGGRLTRKRVERTLVIPSFHIGRTRLSANQLSEGTFKTLAIVFYLMTDKSRILLLEEPEVCVHHGLLTSIIDLAKDVAKRKQIVVSTHSDFVLDAMIPPNVFVVTNSRERGTVVKNVPEAMSDQEYKGLRHYLRTSGGFGEYWRHGGLEF